MHDHVERNSMVMITMQVSPKHGSQLSQRRGCSSRGGGVSGAGGGDAGAHPRLFVFCRSCRQADEHLLQPSRVADRLGAIGVSLGERPSASHSSVAVG